MFSNDKDETAAPKISTRAEPIVMDAVVETKNVYKDMNTGELKEVRWTDPAMAANTK
jgi:hypothetical protein